MDFSDIFTTDNLSKIIDLLVIWFALFYLIKMIRGTRAMQLVRGLIILIIVRLISWRLDLRVTSWLLDQAINWGPIALIVIFQQEIRRGLENIGRNGLIFDRGSNEQTKEQKLVLQLSNAIDDLSQTKTGALIAIEQKDSLQEYISTGTFMDADVSYSLLENIFVVNTPLHDGAVIIKDFRIAAAGTYLPLSDNRAISKTLGTRHRSAAGLSENTDAIVIVVSEENGNVSIAENGYLNQKMSAEEYRDFLAEKLITNSRYRTSVLGFISRRNNNNKKIKETTRGKK